jgi:hypothetical protein
MFLFTILVKFVNGWLAVSSVEYSLDRLVAFSRYCGFCSDPRDLPHWRCLSLVCNDLRPVSMIDLAVAFFVWSICLLFPIYSSSGEFIIDFFNIDSFFFVYDFGLVTSFGLNFVFYVLDRIFLYSCIFLVSNLLISAVNDAYLYLNQCYRRVIYFSLLSRTRLEFL